MSRNWPRPAIRDFEINGVDSGVQDRAEPEIRKMSARKTGKIHQSEVYAAHTALGHLCRRKGESDSGRVHAAPELEYRSRSSRHHQKPKLEQRLCRLLVKRTYVVDILQPCDDVLKYVQLLGDRPAPFRGSEL